MPRKNLYRRLKFSAWTILLASVSLSTPVYAQSIPSTNSTIGELVNDTLNTAAPPGTGGDMLGNVVSAAVTDQVLNSVQAVLDNVDGPEEIEAAAAQISAILDITEGDAAGLVQDALNGDLLGGSLQSALNDMLTETVAAGIDELLGNASSGDLMNIISGLLNGLNGASVDPVALLGALNALGISLESLGLTEEHLNALLGLSVPVCAGAGLILPCENMAWDPTTVTGPTTTVSSGADLLNALRNAAGGSTILLNPGDYNNLNLSGLNFPSNVTIGSADPNNPITISNLSLDNVSNLTLAGLRILESGDGTKLVPRDGALKITDSNNITIVNTIFEGVTSKGGTVNSDVMVEGAPDISIAGHGTGKGLDVSNSSNVTVAGSSFYNLGVGSDFSRSTNTRIVGTSYSNISHDAMDFDAADGLLVEGNYVTGMNVPKGLGHNDVMQFRQFGTPSHNIMIRNNVFTPGDTATHVVFMGDNQARKNGFQGNSFFNVNFEGNTIVSGHAHSIAVYNANGVNINGNTVLRDSTLPTGSGHIPAISVGSSSVGVNITNNIAQIIRAGNELTGLLQVATPGSWNVTGNNLLGRDATMAPPVLSEAPGCAASGTDTAATGGSAAPTVTPSGPS